MTEDTILSDFRAKVASTIRLIPQGLDRWQVATPFTFSDGDQFVVVLQRAAGNWILTDEAHTLHHLAYFVPANTLFQGTRRQLIDASLETHGIEDRGGEFVLPIPDERFGDALFSYLQGLQQIVDVSYLSRERVKSAFAEDFAKFVRAHLPPERVTLHWHDPVLDPQAEYPVDCRVNHLAEPLFLFAIANDRQARDASIALRQFMLWQQAFVPFAIFADQAAIGRKVLSQLTAVCPTQFDGLKERQEQILRYLHRELDRK